RGVDGEDVEVMSWPRAVGSPAHHSTLGLTTLVRLRELAPPRVGSHLAARSLAARRLAPLAEPLREALQRYASRLREWALRRIDELIEHVWLTPPPTAPLETAELRSLDALIESNEGLRPQ